MKTETKPQKMTAQQLTRRIVHKEKIFVLDVRNEEEFLDWHVEGDGIQILNRPYFDLLDGVENLLKQLPEGEDVLVVCAKEGSSEFVAEQLTEAGRSRVYFLEGGMKGWSEHLEPVLAGRLKDGGQIYQFVRIGKGCLSYMIVSGGEAAVVDAVRMTDVYEEFARKQGVTIKHTIDTHLHADHISGGRKLAEHVGAAYWLPEKDAGEVTFPYEKLEESAVLTIGSTIIRIQPVASPGHTIGSTSLLVDDRYLLTGDILFLASIGRPDLAGKAEDWVGDLRHTLYSRYKQLEGDLLVLPAHFGTIKELDETGKVAAKLSDLYRSNPGLNIADETDFRQTVTEHLPQQPNAYQEIRQTNMGRLTPNVEQQREMEIGPNRCAVHDK